MDINETNNLTRHHNTIQDVYGSFFLCGNEFAVAAVEIREVVNELGAYNSIPLSPNYMVGMFNLRGTIVPVVDLRKIFYENMEIPLEDKEDNSNRVIAIIEYGHFSVGIIFDRTGEIFYERSNERIEFCPHTERHHDTIIAGVFKLDNGSRMIQIIDPIEVINLEKLPHIDFEHTSQTEQTTRVLCKCISFKLGQSLCAFKVSAIREVIEVREIENQVLAGNNCLGAVNIRGDIIPIIDFNEFLGGGKTVSDSDGELGHIVIVIKLEESFLGLLVSSLDNIISYYEEDIIQFPLLATKKSKMFVGCIPSHSGPEATLLDHEKLFSDDEIKEIIHDHGLLFKDHSNEVKEVASRDFLKKTYITFTIADRYALDIKLVNEIIDYPSSVISPPGLPENIKGIINLRDELIVVIDSRLMYEMKEKQSEVESKILIFICEGKKYGLEVDSIDSIVSFTSDQALHMPAFSHKAKSEGTKVAVQNIIQVEGLDKRKDCLLELDLPYLVEKLNLSDEVHQLINEHDITEKRQKD
jgi:purine-binding chemotaxis protein CheW